MPAISRDRRITLIGDGIENPANALALLHAAGMFGAACRFRDTKGLAQALAAPAAGVTAPVSAAAAAEPAAATSDAIDPAAAPAATPALALIEGGAEVQALHSRVVACDNLPGARDLYGCRVPPDFALLVGNERRGLSHAMAAVATDLVQVPMLSRRINCLNVAAAAAVALYYLSAPPVGAMAVRREPRGHRPELLLLDPADHFEVGSALRSAAAFGWERVFVQDRREVWFGCGRARRAEGRAAARRGRNDILVVPFARHTAPPYPKVTVITRRPLGQPLHRVQLAGGPRQMVVIPDESAIDVTAADWSRLGRQVELAHLHLPEPDSHYRYHLPASIALAEMSRQVGRRSAQVGAAPRRPVYDAALPLLAAAGGELVPLADLLAY